MNAAATWCETCREHVPGECDGCHVKHSGDEYQSQSYHFHPTGVNGVSGSLALFKSLCLDCYRKDFAKMYPAEKVPV